MMSQEDKDYIISQLENLLGTRPVFYLKFCSQEKFAQDVCDGMLYSNTAKFFREKEIETGKRGQGDIYELVLAMQTENISVFNQKTGSFLFTMPKATAKFQFKDDDLIPIVSFVGIPLRDMILIDANETCATFHFPFTPDEYKHMSDCFGEHCVIIGARELEQRIQNDCSSCGFDYIFDRVEYCCQNRIDRMQAFNTSSKQRFLYKNEDLSYQREYRFAVGIEMPEDHYIRIGKLSNAKTLPSSELQNIAFSISYTSHRKDAEEE